MPRRGRRKRLNRPDLTPLQWLTVALTVALVIGVSAASIHWRSGYYSGQAVIARTSQ